MCLCIYVYITCAHQHQHAYAYCVYMCVYVYTSVSVYVCMHMSAYVYLCVCACVYTCLCVYRCTGICAYICMYVCLHVCVYVYTQALTIPRALHPSSFIRNRDSVLAWTRETAVPRMIPTLLSPLQVAQETPAADLGTHGAAWCSTVRDAFLPSPRPPCSLSG